MTQEHKELLLKDLCARVPYSVKILFHSWDEREMEYTDRVDVLYSINGDEYIQSTNEDYDFSLEDIKPYLFPLPSMTEEQSKIYHELVGGMFGTGVLINLEGLIDFFNRNHLDWRGLIPLDLAIDATNENIY